MKTIRPPLTERAKAVQSTARAVVKQEQRVLRLRKDLETAEQELKAKRKLCRDLLADESLYGSDGQNVGTLP